MIDKLNEIKKAFNNNVELVYKLLDFDRSIIEYVLLVVKKANDKLKAANINNHKLLLDNAIKMIENINEHESLKTNYEIMFNQCVVLLVSYFGSAVEDIFKESLKYRLINCNLDELKNDEIKISLGELKDYEFNIADSISDIITIKKDISFQDMQSIKRAFKEYFGFTIEKDKDVYNIILAQACRHVIVHAGCIVNNRTLNQLAKVNPRDLKTSIIEGESINFTKDEIRIIGTSMKIYIERVIEKILQWKDNECKNLHKE